MNTMIKFVALFAMLGFLLVNIIPDNFPLSINNIIEKYQLLKINNYLFKSGIFYIIVIGNLILIFYKFYIRPIKKLQEGLDLVSQGNLGVCISIKRKRGLGRLAQAFNKMSKTLEEAKGRVLVSLKETRQEKWFHSLLLEMMLELQGCFIHQEVYPTLARFFSRLFPDSSGVLFAKVAPGKLEPVAVWDQSTPEEGLLSWECMALWQWQVHCGPLCSSCGNRRQLSDQKQDCLCVPLGTKSELLGLLQILPSSDEDHIDGQGMEIKKKWAMKLSECLCLILVNTKMNENLRNLSLRDPLTGLFNRRFLEEALERELCVAARQGRPLAVIMLDLDHFKKFNDTYGHPVGDALLKELGLFFRRHIRGSDIVCRYGGEEFMLIMTEASRENVLQRAEDLRLGVKNLRIWHIYQWLNGPSISAGIALYPDNGTTPAGLLKAADLALYQAKEKGRNQVCLAGVEQFRRHPGVLSPVTMTKPDNRIILP